MSGTLQATHLGVVFHLAASSTQYEKMYLGNFSLWTLSIILRKYLVLVFLKQYISVVSF